MKKIKNTSLFLLSVIFTAWLLSSACLAASEITVEANAAVLIEAESGSVLYAQNETAQIAPASTTKLMTALLAAEAIERGDAALTDTVTISSSIYNDVLADGGYQLFKDGDQLSLHDLLCYALVASNNGSCNAIASFIADDRSAFVAMMNTRASELGCTGTHFENCHGLPNSNHYSTAADLALIAAEAARHSIICDIVRLQEFEAPIYTTPSEHVLKSTNKLLTEGKYYYQYATGMKTGYTDAAKYCLVASAEKNGVKLISVVMGAESVLDTDGSTLTRSFSESKKLLEWGFDNFSYRTVISPSDLIAEVPVAMGDGADSVLLRPLSSLTLFLDNDVDASEFTCEVSLYNDELVAPIEADSVLGEVSVMRGGHVCGVLKLVANTGVKLQQVMYIKQTLHKTLSSTPVHIFFAVFILIILLYAVFVIRYTTLRRRAQKAKQLKIQSGKEKMRAQAAEEIFSDR